MEIFIDKLCCRYQSPINWFTWSTVMDGQ